MGNICRSPSAQGVFEALLQKQGVSDDFEIDSAGTHSYHIGQLPDKRAQTAASKKGINLSTQTARIVRFSDFDYYDYIIVMDEANLADLASNCPQQYRYKLYRLLQFLPQNSLRNVPDPYYEGDFDGVLALIEKACIQLLEYIEKS